jgi:hypothetical protein
MPCWPVTASFTPFQRSEKMAPLTRNRRSNQEVFQPPSKVDQRIVAIGGDLDAAIVATRPPRVRHASGMSGLRATALRSTGIADLGGSLCISRVA